MANALKTNPDDLYNPDSTENYRAQARAAMAAQRTN